MHSEGVKDSVRFKHALRWFRAIGLNGLGYSVSGKV